MSIKTYQEQLSEFQDNVMNNLGMLVELLGEPCSNYYNHKFLDISRFDIWQERQIVKLNTEISLDTDSYHYAVDLIDIYQLCKIVDAINEFVEHLPKYDAIENIIDNLASIDDDAAKELYALIMSKEMSSDDSFDDIRENLNEVDDEDYLADIYRKVTSRALVLINNGCMI